MTILLRVFGASETTADSGRSLSSGSKTVSALDEALVVRLAKGIQGAGGEVYRPISPLRTDTQFDSSQWFAPVQLVIGLGSAGVFTVMYQTLAKYLERNKDREVSIERADVKVTIKGHSLPDERELLEKLCPEFAEGKDRTDSEVPKGSDGDV